MSHLSSFRWFRDLNVTPRAARALHSLLDRSKCGLLNTQDFLCGCLIHCKVLSLPLALGLSLGGGDGGAKAAEGGKTVVLEVTSPAMALLARMLLKHHHPHTRMPDLLAIKSFNLVVWWL